MSVSEKTFTTAMANIDARFAGVDARFEEVIEMMQMTNQKVDNLTEAVLTINRRVDDADAHDRAFERLMTKYGVAMDDMQEDITSALTALDKESVRGLDHEKRICRLERVR